LCANPVAQELWWFKGGGRIDDAQGCNQYYTTGNGPSLFPFTPFSPALISPAHDIAPRQRDLGRVQVSLHDNLYACRLRNPPINKRKRMSSEKGIITCLFFKKTLSRDLKMRSVLFYALMVTKIVFSYYCDIYSTVG
jgi:hypothetical protein